MSSKFVLLDNKARRDLACEYVMSAQDGYWCKIVPATRNLEQNAKFHSVVSDIAKSGLQWAGRPRTAAEWKVLLVSGHAMATKEGCEIVPGLENEFVNLRESTALMSKKRGSSLIEYSISFAVSNNIKLGDSCT